MREPTESPCPVCQRTDVEHSVLPYAVFRHLDFASIGSEMVLAHCPSCSAIFRHEVRHAKKTTDALCASESYAHSYQTAQLISVAEFDEPVTRSFLQAEILTPLINNKPAPRVLDIGCYDGALLSELGKRLTNADLHGFDVNPHLAQFFEDPESPRGTFHRQSLREIEPAFDLITLSHSLIYIPDLADLFDTVERLLKPDGILYVHTANIERNPCYVLMGDQHHYYSPINLANLLRHFGFAPRPAETVWFPREIALLATRTPNKQAFVCDDSLNICLQRLADIANNVTSIKASEGQLAVLGTTGNAAFVDSLLGKRLTLFVDENRSDDAPRFRGKSVLLPSDLLEKDILLLPYGEANERLAARLSEQGLQNVVGV